LFPDFSQWFVWFGIPAFDRARNVEYALESAVEDATHVKRTILSNRYLTHWDAQQSVPALLMNATDAGSGKRFVFTPVLLSENSDQTSREAIVEYPFWVGWGQAGKSSYVDIPLSTAAFVSARFPWITPAATFAVATNRGSDTLRLVDGGYVDNSGVETALDLIHSLHVDKWNREHEKNQATDGPREVPQPLLQLPTPKIRIILIVLTGGSYPQRDNFSFGELLEPIRALLSTRTTRGYAAIERARNESEVQVFNSFPDLPPLIEVSLSDLRVASLEDNFYTLPLGWTMSNRSRDIIALESGHPEDCQAGPDFEQRRRYFANADCIDLSIEYELGGSLAKLARTVAIENSFGEPSPALSAMHKKSLDYNAIFQCVSDSSSRPWTLREYDVIRSLTQSWDENAQTKDFRVLAYLIATTIYETGGLKIEEELGSKEVLNARYAPPRLGNVDPNDGYRYRGRGFISLTGRYNYELFGKIIKTAIREYPDVAMNYSVSGKLALAYLTVGPQKKKFLSAFATDEIDWRKARQAINGAPALGSDEVRKLTEPILDCYRKVQQLPRSN
jgi:hypothetical protein